MSKVKIKKGQGHSLRSKFNVSLSFGENFSLTLQLQVFCERHRCIIDKTQHFQIVLTVDRFHPNIGKFCLFIYFILLVSPSKKHGCFSLFNSLMHALTLSLDVTIFYYYLWLCLLIWYLPLPPISLHLVKSRSALYRLSALLLFVWV